MNEELTFEEEMMRLEEIVNTLEKGNLMLEESFNLFKEGVEISKRLEKRLSEVEGKITLLINENEEIDFKEEEKDV
ncbi:MAG: Exodeoxyribonuclease 7 small subunit [Caldanaerobacter subterraneus]|jgi:exodeoxyribonuclease VII small subunit|uniref:Exodeoxyribonuclease 7 small subunit n=2 Tax=Thermoanaerobacter TaxID=1754 RepID=EX7S_THEPX|nr:MULTISPECIES: exodeoxyribonuclease VII small subunit [Thermoanaerobacter]B0K0U9.1 RecName: Full=Exodeoxyribonuclease 7 small subunit; AltName: Full=Exodeoxyribonuclease VII small subunit; Short=Exonuclease VII small subunit [Thermoanaerobacter sp. X514]KUJ91283.1 MAG: exodeoxyribonuclease VII small subunit [Thermoanaerobacter thermocopriae]KUK34509.1 MAG: Exodeoxyribonuclease 7 small subunit [Caldanaerobacter subterraneus]MDI3529538.1 exodeoxyribonuclease small subunit [Thermoanaerobacter sp